MASAAMAPPVYVSSGPMYPQQTVVVQQQPQYVSVPVQVPIAQGRWVPVSPPNWSLTPAFAGQQPGSQTQDGRPLFQMMVFVQ